jgi:hypothetical protein
MCEVSSEDVGSNLKDIFGSNISKETYFPRWCQLGAFLTRKPEVLRAMEKLDNLMFEKLCKKKGLNPNAVPNRKMVTEAYSAYQQGNTYLLCQLAKSDVSHLLSDILTEKEKAFHFKTNVGRSQEEAAISSAVGATRTTLPDTREKVPTYHGFVQPADFRLQLEKKTHWKDPGAQLIHGEYTHRLQWFAVFSELWSTGATASNVFASIGKYPATFASQTSPGADLYLWDALCDRTNGVDVSFSDREFLTSDGPARGDDFRSPENLNLFLTSNDGFQSFRWPLLKIFLVARQEKREPQFAASKQFMLEEQKNNPDFKDPMYYFQATYLSKKLYNQTFEEARKDNAKLDVIQQLLESDQIWKF